MPQMLRDTKSCTILILLHYECPIKDSQHTLPRVSDKVGKHFCTSASAKTSQHRQNKISSNVLKYPQPICQGMYMSFLQQKAKMGLSEKKIPALCHGVRWIKYHLQDSNGLLCTPISDTPKYHHGG